MSRLRAGFFVFYDGELKYSFEIYDYHFMTKLIIALSTFSLFLPRKI